MKSKLLLLPVLLLLPIIGSAQGPRDGSCGFNGERGGFGGGPRFERMQQELNLSKEQSEKIRALREKNRSARKEDRGERFDNKRKIRDAIFAPDSTEQSVRAAVREAARDEEEFALERWREINELRSVLTPEQREKLSKIKEERGGIRGPGMGHRMGERFRGPRSMQD